MKKGGVFFLLPLLLSSCGENPSLPYDFPALEESPFEEIQGQGYYRPSSFASLEYAGGTFDSSIEGIASFGHKRHYLPSTGKPRLTVIPVDFEEYPGEAGDIEALEDAFKGSRGRNQYVSVAEYYDLSSQHRLQLDVHVASSYFRSPYSYAELKGKSQSSAQKNTLTSMYTQGLTWYNETFHETLEAGEPLYFIYHAPYDERDSSSSMLWAFTINDPYPVAWSSFDMMHIRDDKAVDAHTYIHETGHLLGLKDYYDYLHRSDLSSCSPLGRMDMMDCSLGDMNGFSKMVLDWARPYVATEECEITLRPFEGNGDLVLLSSSWNGTPYDEYLLLEFYTPTYLNSVDAFRRNDPTLRLMNKPGVKCYHVDARLGVYDERLSAPISFLTPSSDLTSRSVDLYQHNCSSSSSFNPNDAHLIQLLDASSSSSKLIENYVASDHVEDLPYGSKTAHLRDSLYAKGMSFSFEDFSFHDGSSLPFSFEIASLTSAEARIKITKRS